MTNTNTAISVQINGNELKRILRAAHLATCSDRDWTDGVHFSCKGGRLRVTATNGKWVFDYLTWIPSPEIGSVFLDSECIKKLIKVCPGRATDETTISLIFDGPTVSPIIGSGHVRETYTRVDVQFPDVDSVMTVDPSPVTHIGLKDEYIQAVGESFTLLKARGVKLSFSGEFGLVTLTSEDVPGLVIGLMPYRLTEKK